MNLNDNYDIALTLTLPVCYQVFTKLLHGQILQSFTEFEDKIYDLLVRQEERCLYQTWLLNQLKMKTLNLPLGYFKSANLSYYY